MFGIILLLIAPVAAFAGVCMSLPPDTPDAYDDRGNINGTHRP